MWGGILAASEILSVRFCVLEGMEFLCIWLTVYIRY